MLLEETLRSTALVRIDEPHFDVFPEFRETSYVDRTLTVPSESFESLLVGLQNALWQPGGVPEEHRINSLSVDAVISGLEWSDHKDHIGLYDNGVDFRVEGESLALRS